MLTPRTRDGWTLLIVAVLLASTIVTAALAAALTALLFPNGFLVDVPAPRAGIAETITPALATTLPRENLATTGSTGPTDESALDLSWRASVTCSVLLIGLGELKKD